jgi:hypothetical protein
MSNILQVAVPTGQPALIWPARSDPTVNSLLFINQDINNTVWLGQTSTVTAGGVNSIPILPNGTFSGDAASAWYVVGNVAGTKPLVMVPNGQAYFLGLTAGLGKLVIPQIQSPNFVTGVSGWIIRKDGSAEFNSIVIRGSTLLGSVELQYSSGTPALNTLIYSNSVTEFQDTAGNWVLAGSTTYGPDPFTGIGFIAMQLNQGEIQFWHTTGTTMGGATPPWQGDAVISWDGQGIVLQEAAGFGIELEALNGGAVTLIGNQLIAGNLSGLSGFLPIVENDTSDNANNNAATQALTAQFTIPAGDAHIGAVYEIEVPFNGVFQASGLSFKPALNTTSVVTSLGDGVNAALLGAGVGFTGWVRLIMRVKTVGAGGTVDYFIEGGLGQNAQHTATNSAILSSQSTGMPFDTTSSNTLRVNSVWTAAVAGQAVTGHGSTFTRKGP